MISTFYNLRLTVINFFPSGMEFTVDLVLLEPHWLKLTSRSVIFVFDQSHSKTFFRRYLKLRLPFML